MRALALLAGLAGGALASQVPAFTQQYYQRLGGAADELAVVVADFDRTARSAGLDREGALARYAASADPFFVRRGRDMGRTIARHDRLGAARDRLSDASALTRATAIVRQEDRALAAATWADFRPAVPLTADGLAFGSAGFLSGFLGVHGLAGLRPRRRANG